MTRSSTLRSSGSKPGHVDVNVAIADVAEQPRRRLEIGTPDNVWRMVDEGGQRRRWKRHIELVGRTERIDRLGVALAVVPQLRPPRGIDGHCDSF